MSSLVVIFFCVIFIADILVIISSYFYSRFIFNGYMKNNYRQKWEELVDVTNYRGLNLLSFDKTPALGKFRLQSIENSEDAHLRKLSKTSVILFKIGLYGWFVLFAMVILIAVVFKNG